MYRLARIALVAVLLAVALAAPAGAALRSYAVRWLPSPSAGVEGYELTLSTFHGLDETVVDLGLPKVTLGFMTRVIALDADEVLVASLRAYGGGQVSSSSNEIIILRDPTAPLLAGPSISAVTGLPGVVSGEVVVVAEAAGAVESVSFAIDGASYRVENQAPWSLAGDAGQPGSEIGFDTTLLEDGPHVLEAIAWTGLNASGVPSAPLRVSFAVDNGVVLEPPSDPSPPPTSGPPPPSPPPGVAPDDVVGLYTRGGELRLLRFDGTSELLYEYHLIRNYDVRPVWCDLDADGDRDLVVGFGPGSLSQLMLLTLEDLEVVGLQVIRGTGDRYAESWGETFPGCGDVDGDGRNELAIGMGAGSGAAITMLDDRQAGWAILPGSVRNRVVTLPSESTLGADYPLTGVAKPVLADVDGDGMDEIVVGRSEGGRGTVSVLDDAAVGYRVMFSLVIDDGLVGVVNDPTYQSTDGSTDVAAGDIDGDGRAEIVVATRRGGVTGVDVYDDALGQYGLLVDSGLQAASGAALEVLKPTLADPDRDGRLEIGVVIGEGSGHVQLIDDGDAGFTAIESGTASGGYDVPADADVFWPAIQANP